MTQQNCGEKLILLHRINCLTDIGETGNDKMSTSLTRSANPSGGKMTTPPGGKFLTCAIPAK